MFFGDLESFHGSDGGGGEQMSEEAFEQFQEQMRATARQLKALQKGEQKKKKKEDRLAKILSEFFKKKAKTSLVLLAAQVLAENIPPSFVLSILILSDEESLQDAKKTIEEEGSRLEKITIPEELEYLADWINIIAEYAARDPLKLLSTAKNDEKKLKYILVEFVTAVINDYKETEDAEKLAIQTLRLIIDQIQKNAEYLEQLREKDFGEGQ